MARSARCWSARPRRSSANCSTTRCARRWRARACTDEGARMTDLAAQPAPLPMASPGAPPVPPGAAPTVPPGADIEALAGRLDEVQARLPELDPLPRRLIKDHIEAYDELHAA